MWCVTNTVTLDLEGSLRGQSVVFRVELACFPLPGYSGFLPQSEDMSLGRWDWFFRVKFVSELPFFLLCLRMVASKRARGRVRGVIPQLHGVTPNIWKESKSHPISFFFPWSLPRRGYSDPEDRPRPRFILFFLSLEARVAKLSIIFTSRSSSSRPALTRPPPICSRRSCLNETRCLEQLQIFCIKKKKKPKKTRRSSVQGLNIEAIQASVCTRTSCLVRSVEHRCGTSGTFLTLNASGGEKKVHATMACAPAINHGPSPVRR